MTKDEFIKRVSELVSEESQEALSKTGMSSREINASIIGSISACLEFLEV